MPTHGIPMVAEAHATANAWLTDHLPDRFTAGVPTYEPAHGAWQIPIWLTYPGLVPLGPVGDLCVDAVSGEVQAHTPLAQMKTQALHLYEQHRAAIDAPLVYTGDALFARPGVFTHEVGGARSPHDR